MKNLLKPMTAFILIAFLAFSFSSCDKDACYECDAIIPANPSYGLSNGFSGCVGENVAGYNNISSFELETQVDVHESQGGFCRKIE